MDAEEYRRFQEFQRFQDYQRFVQSQPGPSGGDSGLVPVPPQHQHVLHEQLEGMRRQLARIEKTTNPPWWRKIMRSRWISGLIGAVLLIILAVWGVPALIHHYFGGDDNTDASNPSAPANLPLPIGQSGELATGPHDAVADVYLFIAQNNPKYLCGGQMNQQAAQQFAAATGTATCAEAVRSIHASLTDANAYANQQLTQLPPPVGNTMVIASCQFTVVGGPALGTFTVTKQDKGWQITNYVATASCPATSSGSTLPS